MPPEIRIAALESEIAALRAEIADLRRRLGLDSRTSSKPPSSDGLGKRPAPQSLREPSGKASGGQPGHKGETLTFVANPDVVVEHAAPTRCTRCDADLAGIAATVERRQVVDIPEPKPIVTEHRATVVCCPACQMRNKAFPEGVRAPVQYGPRLRASVVYLGVQQLLPEDRLAELCADLFGLPISTATVAKIHAEAAETLAPAQAETLATLKAAPVKHLDETGFRIGGKTQWLHVISSATHTHYRPRSKRGDLLEGVCGTIVHDHWKPYFTMEGVTHALCGAHLLRELRALVENEKERWARNMQRLLRLASRLREPPTPAWITRFERLYQRIVAQGLAFHKAQPPLGAKPRRGREKRRIGHNLALRLRDFQHAVLRFLHDWAVPFTNNQAEQDVRMMKVKQKISGGFRTPHGAETFCTLRGFLSTQRKQRQSPYTALATALA